jgi:hypothetical protein
MVGIGDRVSPEEINLSSQESINHPVAIFVSHKDVKLNEIIEPGFHNSWVGCDSTCIKQAAMKANRRINTHPHLPDFVNLPRSRRELIISFSSLLEVLSQS